ncbi:hypothetical protein ACWKWV_08215 [Castellaniella ginsengisoli]
MEWAICEGMRPEDARPDAVETDLADGLTPGGTGRYDHFVHPNKHRSLY